MIRRYGVQPLESCFWESETPGAPATALVYLDLAGLELDWRPGETLLSVDGLASNDDGSRPIFGGAVLEVLEPGAVVIEDPGDAVLDTRKIVLAR